MSSISSYVSNNSGTLPNSAATISTALGDYNPGFYPKLQVYYGTTVVTPATTGTGGVGDASTLTGEDVIFISGVTCSGTTATTTNASSRSYVVLYAIESGSTLTGQCIGS